MDGFDTKGKSRHSPRWPARRTALLALAFLLPLSAALIWFAFAYRVTQSGAGTLEAGKLPASIAVLASLFSAAGAAVLAALFIANRNRLRTVLRPSRGKTLTAVALAAIAPVLVLGWMPWLFGPLFAILFFTEVVRDLPAGLIDPDFWPWGLALFGILAACYLVSALLISGIASRRLRLSAFILIWWSVYCAILLATGYQRLVI